MIGARTKKNALGSLSRKTLFILLIGAPLLLSACQTPGIDSDYGRAFANPEEAGDALVNALSQGDQAALGSILGPDSDLVLGSGDSVQDQNQKQWFVNAYRTQHTWIPWSKGVAVLEIGKNAWPFPIPLVEEKGTWWGRKGGWRFDTAEGAGEILNRRIGRNELNTIQSCLAFVDAEREYYHRNPEQNATPGYARYILSSPGEKDGLYWETSADESPSPLGALYAAAQSMGYSPSQGADKPFHGYLYQVLDAQGSNAPGGAYSYMVGDRMADGFALLATPAKYGSSGVMSFLVNQVGLVYEKDLGPETAEIATATKTFDPDDSWALIPQSPDNSPQN